MKAATHFYHLTFSRNRARLKHKHWGSFTKLFPEAGDVYRRRTTARGGGRGGGCDASLQTVGHQLWPSSSEEYDMYTCPS